MTRKRVLLTAAAAAALITAGWGLAAVAGAADPSPWKSRHAMTTLTQSTPAPAPGLPAIPQVITAYTPIFTGPHTVTVQCPAGSYATGGGFFTQNDQERVRISQPWPDRGAPTGWRVEFWMPPATSVGSAYAVCTAS